MSSSDIKSDKHELAENIARFIQNHGAEETAKLISRSLLFIVASSGGSEASFKDDLGMVSIRHTPIRNTH